MHTGKLSKPNFLVFLIFFLVSSEYTTELAPYISLHIFSILTSILSSSLYNKLSLLSSFESIVSIISFATSTAPLPPSKYAVDVSHLTPNSLQYSLTKFISSSVSVSNLFIQTITGTLNLFKFSICFPKFSIPIFNISILGSDNSFSGIPPLYFNARIVATNTDILGTIPAFLHFILKNFSAPRSAPNPASVTQ
ncbi:hypothetical protein D3C76_1334140 [compost metagenome]